MKSIISWLQRLTTRTTALETGVATLESGKAVYTAAGTITAADAKRGAVVSNVGATGAITVVLPPAVPGMAVSAVVEATQELRIDPDGSETIALPFTGAQGAAGKYIVADAATEHVNLVCITEGTWDVVGYSGTWTAQG